MYTVESIPSINSIRQLSVFVYSRRMPWQTCNFLFKTINHILFDSQMYIENRYVFKVFIIRK
jgi:hypothetical protein